MRMGSTTAVPLEFERACEWLGGDGRNDNTTFSHFPAKAGMQLRERPVLEKSDPI